SCAPEYSAKSLRRRRATRKVVVETTVTVRDNLVIHPSTIRKVGGKRIEGAREAAAASRQGVDMKAATTIIGVCLGVLFTSGTTQAQDSQGRVLLAQSQLMDKDAV